MVALLIITIILVNHLGRRSPASRLYGGVPLVDCGGGVVVVIPPPRVFKIVQ